MTSELVEQNEEVLAELRELAGENSNIVSDLLAKSKENRLLAIANTEKISKRKERLYRNREDIEEMVKRIGAPISLAELFDVDDREL
jgi:ribosomal protein S8